MNVLYKEQTCLNCNKAFRSWKTFNNNNEKDKVCSAGCYFRITKKTDGNKKR